MFKPIFTLLVASACWAPALASKRGHSHAHPHPNPLEEAVSSAIKDIKGLGKPASNICHSFLGGHVTATITHTPAVTVTSTKTITSPDPDCTSTTATVKHRGLDADDLIKIGPHSHSRYAVQSACNELGVKSLPIVTIVKTVVGHHALTKSVTVTSTV